MADNERQGEGNEEVLDDYRRRLREAVSLAGTMKPVRIDEFLKGNPPPGELAGNRDRTYGFFRTTTILKALGPDEGLKAAVDYNPNLDEVATAYLVVFGRTLREDAPEIDAKRVKRALARACGDLCDRLAEVMAYADRGQHHAITALMGECKWCAREVCGDETAANTCDLDIILHGKEEKK